MQVANSYVGGDGLKTQYDWLVLFIFMVGTYVFTVGCTLLYVGCTLLLRGCSPGGAGAVCSEVHVCGCRYVDANNAGYPGAMAAWTANGRLGKKPR